jgi:hypothetical protein
MIHKLRIGMKNNHNCQVGLMIMFLFANNEFQSYQSDKLLLQYVYCQPCSFSITHGSI